MFGIPSPNGFEKRHFFRLNYPPEPNLKKKNQLNQSFTVKKFQNLEKNFFLFFKIRKKLNLFREKQRTVPVASC